MTHQSSFRFYGYMNQYPIKDLSNNDTQSVSQKDPQKIDKEVNVIAKQNISSLQELSSSPQELQNFEISPSIKNYSISEKFNKIKFSESQLKITLEFQEINVVDYFNDLVDSFFLAAKHEGVLSRLSFLISNFNSILKSCDQKHLLKHLDEVYSFLEEMQQFQESAQEIYNSIPSVELLPPSLIASTPDTMRKKSMHDSKDDLVISKTSELKKKNSEEFKFSFQYNKNHKDAIVLIFEIHKILFFVQKEFFSKEKKDVKCILFNKSCEKINDLFLRLKEKIKFSANKEELKDVILLFDYIKENFISAFDNNNENKSKSIYSTTKELFSLVNKFLLNRHKTHSVFNNLDLPENLRKFYLDQFFFENKGKLSLWHLKNKYL